MRIVVETVMAFYIERAEKDRETSPDLRLNSHRRRCFSTAPGKSRRASSSGKGPSDMGEVLQRAVLRISGTCGDGAGRTGAARQVRLRKTC